MEDTVIAELPPSSSSNSPSEPLEDQFGTLTFTGEATADNNGESQGGEDEVGGATEVVEREVEVVKVEEERKIELTLIGKATADDNGRSHGGEDGVGGATEVVEGEVDVDNVKEERKIEEREDVSSNDAINSNGNGSSNDEYSKRSRFPVRPEAELCTFYLRTGMCKFGMNCKFNHPPDRKAAQIGKVKGKEESIDKAAETLKDKNDSVEKEGKIDCKYFDRPGGCKFGKACKFNHSKKTAPISELNFMVLPVRPGEKECPYYMRNGSCKFGASCRFNHPHPTSIGVHDTFASYDNGGSISSPTALQSTFKPWAYPASVKESPPHVPLMIPPTQSSPSRPEWTAYQAHAYTPGRSVHVAPAYANNSKSSEGNTYAHQQGQIVADEFPERPGQPECSYFLKYGDCKYRSACKFHHPISTQVKSLSCSLSDLGLPLRPGESVCSYYSRYGICKYGPACKYDHPVNHAHSAILDASAVDLTSGLGM